MEWVETTGRTIEEAKEAALDQLGVDAQDAEFEIVEEPRFGLFGRLRSEARVRARVRPTKPRPKDERRERRGRRKAPGANGSVAAGDEESSTGADAKPPTERSQPTAASASSPARAGSAASAAGSNDADSDRTPRRSRSGRGSGPTTSAAADIAHAEAAVPRSAPRARSGRAPDRNSDDDMTPGGGMDVSLDEQGIVAKEFLDGLVDRMSLEAEVVITQPEDETIELNLQGEDLGLLIGPKGATLLAIQDLTRTVVQRKTSAANGRILVDVSGYRRKRRDALARFSRQVAEEVQASGSRRVLEPMSAADRKVVHDTVNQIDGVMTISEGEDPQRRVVILPESANS